MHVRVGADPRVAEQIPCPADLRTPLDDQETLRWAPLLQVDGGAEAGDAAADDQDIEVFHGGGAYDNGFGRRQAARLRQRGSVRAAQLVMLVISMITGA